MNGCRRRALGVAVEPKWYGGENETSNSARLKQPRTIGEYITQPDPGMKGHKHWELGAAAVLKRCGKKNTATFSTAKTANGGRVASFIILNLV